MPLVCLALCVAVAATSTSSHADAAGDKKRAQLLNVKRLLVIPGVSSVPILSENCQPQKPGKSIEKKREPKTQPDEKQSVRAALADYLENLHKLERNAQEKLPARAAARTPYEVVKSDEVARALMILKTTPPELFQSGGRLNSKKFDMPDPEQVKRIATLVHADAVLLGVLDEPRKSNGGYYFDPVSGPGYDSPKVHDKATFDLMLADGTLVLRETIDVVHPLTRIGARQFVVADWIETDDQIIEDLMNEVTRYTPKR